ncbi:MAG: precorrin-3B C(17)-methyltransferase [Rhodospirillaceae bacterium]|nr:precorrin-3B C(17)-methyltransferase [Rhodospirillaceae bacterium]
MSARGAPKNAALVVLGPGGLELAAALKLKIPGAEVHGLKGRAEEGADVVFDEVAAHVRGLFGRSRPIAGLCAAGILIRALVPLLSDKRQEPPVVAVSGDGGSVVPLLGGHRGANRLALAIAEITGGHAAVTTAGDVRLGLALDDPPPGWRVGNPGAAKAVTAMLLAGDPVGLEVEAGDAGWITESDAVFAETAPLNVRVTDQAVENPAGDLVLHPTVLALGVGCERGTDADELIKLAEGTLSGAGLSTLAVGCVVSLDLKADEEAVHALAAHLDVPARFFSAPELEAETPRLANPSEVVLKEVGCHGVAEGAALAAAGKDGELAVEKKTSRRATCAVGRAPGPIDPEATGRPRGTLIVVGIGPGADDWRTPEATKAILGADDVIGYRLYLDLIEDLIGGRERHDSNMTEEEDRARLALDLAAAGRRVALVSSGDAGIYALAALVHELLDTEHQADWNRAEVSVVPGVSAMQAAAARIGAPLGHDFCAISLSDLLTPSEVIEKRLEAAAAGDFVVALYNPVSKRRRKQLTRARDILLSARPPETPVVLARNLGRDGETLDVITLGELEPGHADMLSVIIIGSSRTRLAGQGPGVRVYTPRGYETKKEAPK